MKKCCKCGYENGDDETTCAYCGANEFEPNDGADEPSVKHDETSETNSGKIGKAVAACKKANGERNFILNGVIAVLAIVLALVTLLAPVKISLEPLSNFIPVSLLNKYYVITDIDRDGIEDEITHYYTVGSDGEKIATYDVKTADGISGRYMYVDQSIFDLIGSLPYLIVDIEKDDEKINKLIDEFDAADEKADKEFNEWLAERNGDDDDIKFIAESTKQREKIINKYLSDVDILAYLSAIGGVQYDEISKQIKKQYDVWLESGNHTDAESAAFTAKMQKLEAEQSKYLTSLINIRAMIVFGIVIFALSVAVAIFSLVYLIKAIISLCAKKPQNELFKYLKTSFGLIAAVVIVTALAPIAKLGGGAIAATVVISAALLLCGIGRSFAVGTGTVRDKAVYAIKYTAITAVTLTAYLLMLSTDIFTMTFQNNGVADNTKYPFGFFVNNIFKGFGMMFADIKNSGFLLGYNDGTFYMSIALFAAASIGLTLTVFGTLYNTLTKPANIATVQGRQWVKKGSNITDMAVKTVVLMALALVLLFMSKLAFTAALSDGEKAFASLVDREVDIAAFFKAGAQLWVILGLFIAVIIGDNVVKTPTVYTDEPILPIKKKRK